jgi:hypothetical protein
MEMEEFAKKLTEYISDISYANSEASKANIFLSFIKRIFEDVKANFPQNLIPQLEKRITSNKTILVSGRIDAYLGNVIIEFENYLRGAKLEEARSQLKKYTAILWNTQDIIEYLCIATDGINFEVYRPRSKITFNFSENDIELERVDKFDIRKEDNYLVFKQLDRYFLYRTLTNPNTENMVRDFGLESILLKDCMYRFRILWNKIKKETESVYREWSKYLNIVYGTNINSNEELFLRHTYLATLAKLQVYSYYQRNTLPISNETIIKILNGTIFTEYGIHNFLVEDFFSWIIKEEITEEGINVVNKIIQVLEQYDLTKLNEDIFKELYQQLVDPEERHDLGEYYTPDWLAEMIIKKVINNYKLKVLDPSSGSGTFLAATIRHKLQLMKDIDISQQANLIIDTVFGIDIHPLAVLTSKANYLIALGDALLKKIDEISIPVYLADSLIFPKPTKSISYYNDNNNNNNNNNESLYYYEVNPKTTLILPSKIVESKDIDQFIDSIKDFAIKKSKGYSGTNEGFQRYLERRFSVTKNQYNIIKETIEKLINLINNNEDSIYPFILKNIYKPSILGKFDIVIGNPPWLSYRFINSIERQSKVKEIMKEFNLLDAKDSKLLTQMELATLFLLKCMQNYLKDNGIIAFVLPRAIFSSGQHHNVRNNLLKGIYLGIHEVWDFDGFSPLFKVPACVILASNDLNIQYPIPAINFQGKLKNKNTSLLEIESKIKEGKINMNNTKIMLLNLGTRNAWAYEDLKLCNGKKFKKESSDYIKDFRQGATLVPRSCWFVDMKVHKFFGFNSKEPSIESSKRARETAKSDYKDVYLNGKIENNFLFATLLGTDILPFCNLPLRIIVLPIIPSNNNYTLIKRKINSESFPNLEHWLEEVEKTWVRIRDTKADKMSIYDRINRGKGISIQNPRKRFRIIHNRSGTYLNSSIIDLQKLLEIDIEGNKIMLNGFIADSTTHYYETDNEDNAYFITGILNSKIINNAIKPFQSRGLWGERDIYKIPFEMPIPYYDKSIKSHQKIISLSKNNSYLAKEKLGSLFKDTKIDFNNITPNLIGKLRSEIRNSIKESSNELDELICSIISV